MKRKKLIVYILIGASIGAAAVYLFGTKTGRKEIARLKSTGKTTANTFKTLGKELARNVEQEQNRERNNELKALVKEAFLGPL